MLSTTPMLSTANTLWLLLLLLLLPEVLLQSFNFPCQHFRFNPPWLVHSPTFHSSLGVCTTPHSPCSTPHVSAQGKWLSLSGSWSEMVQGYKIISWGPFLCLITLCWLYLNSPWLYLSPRALQWSSQIWASRKRNLPYFSAAAFCSLRHPGTLGSQETQQTPHIIWSP